MPVFIDTDVIIASLLSSKGASSYLLTKDIHASISSISRREVRKVAKRLKIDPNKLNALLKNQLKTVGMKQTLPTIRRKYSAFVSDKDDAHILAGAIEAKAKFLITYNTRHFDREKIKNRFDILVMTPAHYLQYLRSLQ